jgi:hypothetical protein
LSAIDTIKRATEIAKEKDTDNIPKQDDWFCVKTEPHYCEVCDEISVFIHVPKRTIIVWPDKDDPNILDCAIFHQKHGIDVQILPYEQNFGKCVSYYKLRNT